MGMQHKNQIIQSENEDDDWRNTAKLIGSFYDSKTRGSGDITNEIIFLLNDLKSMEIMKNKSK
ncbi:hypothetical protein QJS10_CPA05g02226 [Acorus calamus]|uniref:Uncharacterized protein n=1 Tax=Acorus calamus TaxID=4465 RepID=A0AAV9ET60_ACOCL|nr:hypothetical protein QJS10_CPA05g02226 [Acorus calamus]